MRSTGCSTGRALRLLLDTHIALWQLLLIPGFPDLPPTSSPIRATQSSSVAASVWEIAIKHALARGLASDMPVSGPDALGFFRAAGYELLAVTADHAAAVATLPPLHRDPFNRIIVAQALHEPLRLMTHDPMVKAYSDGFLLF
jgi:PIN domain nuclease of toxin-antitoxin system